MRSYRDYDGGYPPLPSDVMPDVTNEDDPAYAGQGYSRSARAEHLKAAHFHAKEAVKCLQSALDMLDAEALGTEQVDVEPMDFGDDTDGPETEKARRAALMVLRSLASRSLA
jgi:hypothetical protein